MVLQLTLTASGVGLVLWLALIFSVLVILFIVIGEVFFCVTKRQGILNILLSPKKGNVNQSNHRLAKHYKNKHFKSFCKSSRNNKV